MIRLIICFNPFFIRASVYCTTDDPPRGCPYRATFQSLLHQGISLLWVEFATYNGSLPCCFNPFFIRASVYCLSLTLLNLMPSLKVSIPSSSGHQFTDLRSPLEGWEGGWFQSLLHQGISLLIFNAEVEICDVRKFQSLLHQGISLLQETMPMPCWNNMDVSIPSSSGHQFTAWLGVA